MTLVTPSRRRWALRLAPVVASVLAAAALCCWWSQRDDPLTAEEQPFVGFWATSGGYDYGPDKNPVKHVATEYRLDRTVRWHRVDTRTGKHFFVDAGFKWRFRKGRLIDNYPDGRSAKRYLGGDFSPPQTPTWRITWDGPDRYEMNRVDLPPGVVWPTWVHTRCEAPPSAD